eukprot:766586-Hanusia_phi.AAC.5
MAASHAATTAGSKFQAAPSRSPGAAVRGGVTPRTVLLPRVAQAARDSRSEPESAAGRPIRGQDPSQSPIVPELPAPDLLIENPTVLRSAGAAPCRRGPGRPPRSAQCQVTGAPRQAERPAGAGRAGCPAAGAGTRPANRIIMITAAPACGNHGGIPTQGREPRAGPCPARHSGWPGMARAASARPLKCRRPSGSQITDFSLTNNFKT